MRKKIVKFMFKLKTPTYNYDRKDRVFGTIMRTNYQLETKILCFKFRETFCCGRYFYSIRLGGVE